MTPVELFRNYLLVGEEVKVELPTKADAEYLVRLLRTERYRNAKQLEALGMSDVDPLAGKHITYEILERHDDSIKVLIQATEAPRKQRLSFTIVT